MKCPAQLLIEIVWPPGRAPKSCATCAHADLALRGEEPVRECHLLPPTTMPDEPPWEVTDPEEADEPDPWGSVAADPEDDFPSFTGTHRYPVVTETDWCSHHKET